MIWIAAAIVFVGFLFVFPRQTAKAFAIVAGVAGLIAGYIFLKEYAERNEFKNVKISAYREMTACSDSRYPILITITNNASRTVKQTSYQFYLTRSGYSSKVMGTERPQISNKIIKPGRDWSFCRGIGTYPSLGKPAKNEQWHATVNYVTFFEK